MNHTFPQFPKVCQSRVSDGIVEQIKEAIISGQLHPGDRLPPQREMAEMLGVGRSALLEALRILEESRLIVIRTGGTGGAFVTAPSIEQVSESLDLLFRREGATMGELGEFRAVLESHGGYLAAERASRKEISAVEEQYQELRASRGARDSSCDSSWDDFVHKELSLHLALANLSHNRVTIAALHALQTWEMSFTPLVPESCEMRILRDWQAIIEALKQRDGGKVEGIVQQHILDFISVAQRVAG